MRGVPLPLSMLTPQMHLRRRDMVGDGLPGLDTLRCDELCRIEGVASGGDGMMVSPFDLMRAAVTVKAATTVNRPAEPAWGPKPRATKKPDKRAGVKAARKQRRKAEGRG